MTFDLPSALDASRLGRGGVSCISPREPFSLHSLLC